MRKPDPASFFVGVPRQGQERAIELLSRNWDKYDVFVVEADVGEGKSKIAEWISRWVSSRRSGIAENSCLVGVPNNVLLDQYLSSCKGFDTIRNQERYGCLNHETWSCAERKKQMGACCRSASGSYYAKDACPYLRDLRRSRASQKMVATYHAILAHGLRRDVLVLDEAHNVRPMLQEMAAVRLWRREYGFPRMREVRDVLTWLEEIGPTEDSRIELLRSTMYGAKPEYMVDVSPQEWRGKPADCISLIPVDVRTRTSPLWGKDVRKIVLMSATLNRLDVVNLGLDRRRVMYIELPSSIPPENRPIVYHPVADMRYSGRESSARRMAQWILDEFLPAHESEKGLVHATYAVARMLEDAARTSSSPQARRLMFHSATNKAQVLRGFMEAAPTAGSVLVGSGMEEGLDLAGDLARFQLITQVPRPSVADPATAWLAEHKPEEYEWEVVRKLRQMCGRVCRGPEDWGVTVIADRSFQYRELKSSFLGPSWRAALRE